MWCFIPISNNGSVVVYSRFIRPYFLQHQGDIDQAVNDLSKKGKETCFSLTLNKVFKKLFNQFSSTFIYNNFILC